MVRAKGFAQFIASLAPPDRGIKTFTILFGEAKQEAMKQLAEITEIVHGNFL